MMSGKTVADKNAGKMPEGESTSPFDLLTQVNMKKNGEDYKDENAGRMPEGESKTPLGLLSQVNLKRNGQDNNDQRSKYKRKASQSPKVDYHGVVRNLLTGQYEASLFVPNMWCPMNDQDKGTSVFLGYYNDAKSAARAYDLGVIKFWGPTAMTNFPISGYHNEMKNMHKFSRCGYAKYLVRKSDLVVSARYLKLPFSEATKEKLLRMENPLLELSSGNVKSDRDWLSLAPYDNEVDHTAESHEMALTALQVSDTAESDHIALGSRVTQANYWSLQVGDTSESEDIALRALMEIGSSHEVVTRPHSRGESSKSLDLFPMLPVHPEHDTDASKTYPSSDFTLSLFPVHQQKVEDQSNLGESIQNGLEGNKMQHEGEIKYAE